MKHCAHNSPRRRHAIFINHAAFTLVEMVVALGVMSILLVAMTSTIMMATQALPNADDTNTAVTEAGRAVERMLDDFRTAKYITERSATSIAVVVADRNGDGLPEAIRYSWAGTSGSPLLRQINSAAPETVIDSAAALSFTYHTESETETYPGPMNESSEVELIANDDIGTPIDKAVTNINGISQYFKPTFAADVHSWSLSRVVFTASAGDDNTIPIRIQLRLPRGDFTPGTQVLAEATYNPTALKNPIVWVEQAFDGVTGISPDQGLCLVFESEDSVSSVDLRGYYDVTGLASGLMTEQGPNWTTPSATNALRMYAYGTTTTAAADQTVTRDFITAVGVAITPIADRATTIETKVRTLNRPEVLAAVWEADFSADPTQLDMDTQGQGGWTTSNGGAFDTSTIAHGQWTPGSQHIRTQPNNNFATVTTTEMSIRDTNADGESVGALLRVDRSGSTYAHLFAYATYQSNGTQTFVLMQVNGSGDWETLATYNGLPDAMLDVRVITDTAADTVAVFIDDIHRGTYRYTRVTGSAGARILAGASGTLTTMDHIRIRVQE